jgi:hypothetical protein
VFEREKTVHALDRAATAKGQRLYLKKKKPTTTTTTKLPENDFSKPRSLQKKFVG